MSGRLVFVVVEVGKNLNDSAADARSWPRGGVLIGRSTNCGLRPPSSLTSTTSAMASTYVTSLTVLVDMALSETQSTKNLLGRRRRRARSVVPRLRSLYPRSHEIAAEKGEDFVDENGVRTTVEYVLNDDGKKVKVWRNTSYLATSY